MVHVFGKRRQIDCVISRTPLGWQENRSLAKSGEQLFRVTIKRSENHGVEDSGKALNVAKFFPEGIKK